jgi:hypothetical protein
MIKGILIRAAKKYLDLVDKGTALALQNSRDAVNNRNYEITRENDKLRAECKSLEAAVKVQQRQMTRIREKYPTVWLNGDAAQGVVQLPKLKIAVEFFREENRFCVFIPWADAEGRHPTEFVPPWLEVDPDLPIASIMDNMNGRGILYKIPVRGWDDAIELTRKAEEDHPSYGLSGRMQEKTRSFRCAAGINGTFRREVVQVADNESRVILRLWFVEGDFDPRRVAENTISQFLPAGNLRYVKNTLECDKMGMIYQYTMQVEELEVPKCGYDRRIYIAPKVDFEEIKRLNP